MAISTTIQDRGRSVAISGQGIAYPPQVAQLKNRQQAPAHHFTRVPHTAGVIVPAADRSEGAHGRRGLTFVIPTPAHRFTRIPHTTGVIAPGADRVEGVRRRGGLTVIIPTPAFHFARVTQATGVKAPRRR